jgi:hypothetical protein
MLTCYLRAVSWPDFVREVGFEKVDYEENYDIALSFADEDRAYAAALRDGLEDLGPAVFYDNAEQPRFLGQDVEAYLGPIYKSGSRYVVAVLGGNVRTEAMDLFVGSGVRSKGVVGKITPPRLEVNRRVAKPIELQAVHECEHVDRQRIGVRVPARRKSSNPFATLLEPLNEVVVCRVILIERLTGQRRIEQHELPPLMIEMHEAVHREAHVCG